jgi:hypothetical protein
MRLLGAAPFAPFFKLYLSLHKLLILGAPIVDSFAGSAG